MHLQGIAARIRQSGPRSCGDRAEEIEQTCVRSMHPRGVRRQAPEAAKGWLNTLAMIVPRNNLIAKHMVAALSDLGSMSRLAKAMSTSSGGND